MTLDVGNGTPTVCIVQEEYDRYISSKIREFKRVARLLVGCQASKEVADALSATVRGDVFACRASEWAKEKEKLLDRIEDKEETESLIEAQASLHDRCFYLFECSEGFILVKK